MNVRRNAVSVLLLALLCGCATHYPLSSRSPRAFAFQRDTFAYPNELVWVYGYDAEGKWVSRKREPKPDYAQHCFILARSARQFFENARFDAKQPVADEATYRRLVQRVVGIDPRHPVSEEKRIVVPGYANLRSFSKAHEKLLKEECGGAWNCYAERGNWRMIFPFSRHQQEGVAEQLIGDLKAGGMPIVHVLCFPQLSINHAILIYDAREVLAGTEFIAYDPNNIEHSVALTFDRSRRTFSLPANSYFPGGRVDVYQIYHRWDY